MMGLDEIKKANKNPEKYYRSRLSDRQEAKEFTKPVIEETADGRRRVLDWDQWSKLP